MVGDNRLELPEYKPLINIDFILNFFSVVGAIVETS